MTGDLAARIADQAPFDRSFTELTEAIASRNFTLARVRRSLLHILLGIHWEDLSPRPRSIKILGLRENSSLPALLKEKASLPVLTKTADAPPELAEPLYLKFVELLRSAGVPVATGRFRAEMAVELCNNGPVTIMVESR